MTKGIEFNIPTATSVMWFDARNSECRGSLVSLTPGGDTGERGKWAAQALPFVFGGLWLLAIAGAFGG